MEPIWLLPLFPIYFLIRLKWMDRKRHEIMDRAFELTESKKESFSTKEDGLLFFETLVKSYWCWDKMERHFWIWDINKMRNNV